MSRDAQEGRRDSTTRSPRRHDARDARHPHRHLEFVDGVPTGETVRLTYDNLAFLRGVDVFLNLIPAASIEGPRLGNVERGATRSHQAAIHDQLLDSAPLLLTGNTDTVYEVASHQLAVCSTNMRTVQWLRRRARRQERATKQRS